MVDFTRVIVKILKIKDRSDAKGTGFFITAEGHVLTCYHVISKMSEIWLTWDGLENPVQAQLLTEWSSEAKDFALLQVPITAETKIDLLPLGTAWQPHDNIFTKGFQYSDYDGHPAAGVLTGDTTREGCRLLVLENATHIQGGISGAPAWDLNANHIIGLVTLKWEALNTAYVTPLTEIAKVLRMQGDVHEIARLASLMESKDADSSQAYLWRETADRVDELLRSYSSAFAGRSAELLSLNQFVEKESAGVLVVAAQAGFGKTALLAQWLVLRRGQGLFTAYHFFSSRYDVTRRLTDAYRNLLRQINSYYGLAGVTLPDDENTLRAELYATIQDNPAREDQPLVLLIDGLDEAEKLFPRALPSPLPKGVFVVVSGRAGVDETPPYLQEWTSDAKRITLSRLPREAIQEYLQHIGNGCLASLASDPAVVSLVEDKTEGLPLYLRFLADDMIAAQAKGNNVQEAVTQSPSGFQDYVQKQIDALAQVGEMGQQKVQTLFALLSVARGALSQDDIFSLAGLSVFDLKALPYSVTRWFTSGKIGLSAPLYSFAHPLLAAQFQAALGAQADQSRAELLDYCARWQENRRPYALQYYPDYLMDAARLLFPASSSALETLYQLAEEAGFDQAQTKAFPNDPDLPLQKFEMALQGAAEADDAAQIAWFVLAYARRLLAVQQESPLTALHSGSLERASRLALKQDAESSVLWHLLLVYDLKAAGRIGEARATLQRLAARELPRLTEWRVPFCCALAQCIVDVDPESVAVVVPRVLADFDVRQLCVPLTARGLFSTTLAMVQSIQDASQRSWALADIAAAQAAAGQMEAALVTAQAIPIETMQSGPLTKIAAAQASAGQIEAALKTARSIQPDWMRPAALAQIGRSTAAAGQAGAVQAIWDEALASVQSMGSLMRPGALAAIAKAQAATGQTDAALTTARSIQDEKERMAALTEIANAEAGAGHNDAAQAVWAEARETTRTIPFEQQQAAALSEIAASQAAAGQIEAALVTVQQIPPKWIALNVLAKIAKAQATAGQIEAAWKTAWSIQDEKEQLNALSAIAQSLCASGHEEAAQTVWTELLNSARSLQNDQDRIRLLVKIAQAQIAAGQAETARPLWTEALDTAQAMRPAWMWSGMVTEIAGAEANAGQLEPAIAIWIGALETEAATQWDAPRSSALAAVATAQAEAGQTEAALGTARAIEDAQKRSKALTGIAQMQTAPGPAEASGAIWREALEAAHSVQDKNISAIALADIAKAQETAGQTDASLETARSISDSAARSKALSEIAKIQAAAGQAETAFATWTEALVLVRTLPDDRQRVIVLTEIAGDEVAAGQTEASQSVWAEASVSARTVQNEWLRVKLLAEIAAALAAAGRTEAALAAWAEARAESQTMKMIGLRKVTLAEIAASQAAAGQIAAALDTAGAIQDWLVRSGALADIIKAQAAAGQIDAALALVKSVQDTRQRSEALAAIAASQAVAGQSEAALATARAIGNGPEQSRALAEIAKAQVLRGLGADAIRTAESIRFQQSDYFRQNLPILAAMLFKAGDMPHFKHLLFPCSQSLDSAYQICGFLAQAYPAQASAIAAAIMLPLGQAQ
jgi:hypothetical protein